MGARSTSDRRSWRAGAGAFALALLCVFAIALLQRSGALDRFNVAGMTLMGTARGEAGAVTTLMIAATRIGDDLGRLIIVGLSLAALLWAGRRAAARWLALVMAGGTLLNLGLKQIFAAPRPELLPHLDKVHSYSFPSGHASGNMMLFGALALLMDGPGAYVAAALTILVIGVSRVWLGVHWPSDVLAGWVEGAGWLAFCHAWKPQGRG